MEIKLEDFYNVAKFQVLYVDCKEDEWTVPALLTKERAEKFCNDLSIIKIRIITTTTEYELDVL